MHSAVASSTPQGRVIVDEPAAIRALTFMCDAIGRDGFVPPSVLTWQEEQVRFAFQNGDAVFMRNWPYAWPLLQDGARSKVANRFAVAPFPAEAEGRPDVGARRRATRRQRLEREPGAGLGARQLSDGAGTDARTRAPRRRSFPARRSLYDSDALAEALPIPIEQLRSVLDAAARVP